MLSQSSPHTEQEHKYSPSLTKSLQVSGSQPQLHIEITLGWGETLSGPTAEILIDLVWAGTVGHASQVILMYSQGCKAWVSESLRCMQTPDKSGFYLIKSFKDT